MAVCDRTKYGDRLYTTPFKMHDTPFDDMENLLSTEHDLEHSYIKEERKIVVHRALSNLSEDYRTVPLAGVFRGLFQQRSGDRHEKE